MRAIHNIFVVVSALAAATANARCGDYTVKERFDSADRVVLVSILTTRDGPVPWPYRLQKGALPGKLLTLRVLKAWKGDYLENQTIYGWTQGPHIEDSYPITEVGTKILVYFSSFSAHEVRACNAATPDEIARVTAELDEIALGDSRSVKPNTSLERTRDR